MDNILTQLAEKLISFPFADMILRWQNNTGNKYQIKRKKEREKEREIERERKKETERGGRKRKECARESKKEK